MTRLVSAGRATVGFATAALTGPATARPATGGLRPLLAALQPEAVIET